VKLAAVKSGNKTAEQYIGQEGLTSLYFLVYQDVAIVPVAQLDRALASGAKAEKLQASNNQKVTESTKDVLSSCLAFSVSEAIEKHPELEQIIIAWPDLPEHIKAAIKALMKTA